jgi:tRNA threonylcarbamoyladenosine biosynthesis protein TsaB
MGLILLLETATHVCSVSLARDGEVIENRESKEEKSHASQLTVFIQEVLQAHQLKATELDAVAVSKGPGSYTGLRIGVSTAKGLCYGADVPLIAIDTLKAMAWGIKNTTEYEPDAWICPMIDARRMEVYAAIYNANLEEQRGIKAEVIDENSYGSWLQDRTIYFMGTGADKLVDVIKHPNAKVIEHFVPSANYIASMAEKAYQQKKFEDVAYFEPFYLKEFMATVPKKNIYR